MKKDKKLRMEFYATLNSDAFENNEADAVKKAQALMQQMTGEKQQKTKVIKMKIGAEKGKSWEDRKDISTERREAALRLAKEERSNKEIAQIVGVEYATASRYVKDYRAQQRREREKEMREMYKEGATLAEICMTMDTTYCIVRRALFGGAR